MTARPTQTAQPVLDAQRMAAFLLALLKLAESLEKGQEGTTTP